MSVAFPVRPWALSLLLGVALTAQAGVVESYSPNKAFLQAGGSAQFLGPLASPPPATSSDFAVASVPGSPGYDNDAEVNLALAPPAGLGTAQGQLRVTFNAGAGAAADTFAFDASGTASALTADGGPGNPLSAQVSLAGSFTFYLDPIYSGLAAGAYAGALSLPGLRGADAFESFSLVLFNSHGPVMTRLPGQVAVYVPLYIGENYQLRFNYEMAVPHGIDPPFALSLAGSIQAVPEPAASLLLLAGLAVVAGRGRSAQCGWWRRASRRCSAAFSRRRSGTRHIMAATPA